jgi:hypothetical protein
MGRLPQFRNLNPLHFFRSNLLYFVLFVPFVVRASAH